MFKQLFFILNFLVLLLKVKSNSNETNFNLNIKSDILQKHYVATTPAMNL